MMPNIGALEALLRALVERLDAQLVELRAMREQSFYQSQALKKLYDVMTLPEEADEKSPKEPA